MRILVVGAGIGGLSFINALRRIDCAIDVVEKSDEFRPLGVGIVLHPNALAVLDEVGLAGQVKSAGAQLEWIELMRGEVKLALSLPTIWQGATYPTIAIARSDLHDILTRAALSNPRVNLRMGMRVVGIAPVGQQTCATFGDSTIGHYDLIVGADGVHSSVRQLLWPGTVAVSTGLAYIRFATRHTIALAENTWRTYELPDSSFGFIPLSHDRVHCFFQFRSAQASVSSDDAEAFLRAEVGVRRDIVDEAIGARCGPYHVGVAFMVRPGAWGQGASVLLGDAAHAVPPTLSEGGGLAMEDALVLARALENGRSIPAAISHYQHCRKDRILWMYRMGLSQVNARNRQRTSQQMDPEVALTHMREMYRPLRAPAWIDPPAPESAIGS